MGILRNLFFKKKTVNIETQQLEDAKSDPSLRKVIELALKKGWSLFDLQPKNKMARFSKDGVRINVYYGKNLYTIATILNHPKKGATQLFRKHVDLGLLGRIMDDPRSHTGIGYYTKNIKK